MFRLVLGEVSVKAKASVSFRIRVLGLRQGLGLGLASLLGLELGLPPHEYFRTVISESWITILMQISG